MKKLLSILLSLISVICIAFAFVGCGETIDEEEVEKGFFCTVEDAYSMGYLTHEQVMSIAYHHNGGIELNEEIMDENYKPLPITPKKLSKKTEISIRLTPFGDAYSEPEYSELSGIRIDKYYGTFNGYIAVMVSNDHIGVEQREWTERFADIRIHYSDGNRIRIWRKADEPVEVRGELYTMEQAYENGWLTEDDLKSIACSYYDGTYLSNENPYSGMYTSTEELTEEMETEIKQAFLNQVVNFAEGNRDRVDIKRYYGTYNGNVVVTIASNYICFDHNIEPEAEVGGVIFKDYWAGYFKVYHIV